MTEHYHAIVWIDHHQARVFHFNAQEADHQVVHPHHPHQHIHHKANSIGSGHAAEDQDFFREVTAAISEAHAVLITGPGTAKNELIKHIAHHSPHLMERVSGTQTLDHPSDAELVAYARKYFRAADRMHSQRE